MWYPVGLAVAGSDLVWASDDKQMMVCPKLPKIGKCSQFNLQFVPRHLFAAPMPLGPGR